MGGSNNVDKGRRQFLKCAGAAVGSAFFALPAAQRALAAVAGTAPAADGAKCKEVKVAVHQECVAPNSPTSNFCTIGGQLSGLGIDGTDIIWMVSLFFNDQWRIQIQAFSEETERECQYPIHVKGSYSAPGQAKIPFSTKTGIALGITPDDFPELVLTVDWVKVDPCSPNCG